MYDNDKLFCDSSLRSTLPALACPEVALGAGSPELPGRPPFTSVRVDEVMPYGVKVRLKQHARRFVGAEILGPTVVLGSSMSQLRLRQKTTYLSMLIIKQTQHIT